MYRYAGAGTQEAKGDLPHPGLHPLETSASRGLRFWLSCFAHQRPAVSLGHLWPGAGSMCLFQAFWNMAEGAMSPSCHLWAVDPKGTPAFPLALRLTHLSLKPRSIANWQGRKPP